MALSEIYGGATLYVPGAYTVKNVTLTGAAASVAVGKVAIIGESSDGPSGSTGIMQFSPQAMAQLIAIYGDGPIVDAARALAQPSNDPRITSGASAIYVYKTNPSTQSELELSVPVYTFTTGGATVTLGDTYTNNGQTFTVTAINGDIITATGTGVPLTPSGSAELGVASAYALLASSTITNTGASLIKGNVGTAPGTSIVPGGWTLQGSSHSYDASAIAAQAAAASAYAVLAAETPTQISNVLGGVTLTPGVYTESSGTFTMAADSTLTLNGAGVYVFQCASTLVTGAGATIALTGGATAANVYFLCGSSATLGAANTFNGNIIATATITLGGGTVNGSMIALGGAVTISVATNVTASAASSSPLILASGPGDAIVYYTSFDQLTLNSSPWGEVTSQEYGTPANLVSVAVVSNAADEEQATVSSSAPFAVTVLTALSNFSVRENGGATNVFTLDSTVSTPALLLTALATPGKWSLGLPTTLTFSTAVGSTPAATTLIVSQNPDSADFTLGYARDFELVSGATNDMLSPMHIASGLQIGAVQPGIELIVSGPGGINEDTNNSVGDLGGIVYLEVGYAGTTATLSINATNLTTSVVGGLGVHLNIKLANYPTLQDLASFIDGQPGYSAAVPGGANAGLNPNVLDQVTNMGIASASLMPGQIKADFYTVGAYILANSSLIEVASATGGVGLPAAMTATYLTGAILAPSSTSDFIAGLAALEQIDDIDIVVPLVSQDATFDIIEDASYTDPDSNYSCASILAATNTHCMLMSNTANRKERVAYLGYRGTFAQCITESLSLNSAYCSLLIQDVEVQSISGVLEFAQPHIAASICAGMQAGADIGQPTTKKLINCTAIQQVGQGGVVLSLANQFSPKTSLNQAIANGIMPLNNPASGGIQIVVQNATYSVDNNFVYNRPSVFSAMNYISKVLRASLEDQFCGTKNQTTTPDAIEKAVIGIMADFLKANITVGDSSNLGLGFKGLTVVPQGDAVFIDITVTPVQGIDFILLNLNFDNIQLAAAA